MSSIPRAINADMTSFCNAVGFCKRCRRRSSTRASPSLNACSLKRRRLRRFCILQFGKLHSQTTHAAIAATSMLKKRTSVQSTCYTSVSQYQQDDPCYRHRPYIGVNFYKAASLEPSHFLGCKAFLPLSPPLFPAAFSQNEG